MKRGFTLAELIIGMLISSILILTVGVISGTAVTSYEKLRKEAQAYDDLYYGVDLIERSVRRAESVSWGSNTLTLGMWDNTTNPPQPYSAIFQNNGNSLTYKRDSRSSDAPDIVMQGVSNLTFAPNPPTNTTLFNATLNGTKDNIVFTRSISVMRRN